MLTQQRQMQFLVTATVEDLTFQRSRQQLNGIKVSLGQIGANLSTAGFKHSLHRSRLPINDTATTGLNDLGLGFFDLLQRVAQNLHVIQTDVGQNGDLGRLNGVGGIVLAAQANFQRDNIALMALAIKDGKTMNEVEETTDIVAHFKNPAMPSVAMTADAAIKIASARPAFADTDTFLEMIGFDKADIRRIKGQEQKARGLQVLDEMGIE
jgi:hypothetical protein